MTRYAAWMAATLVVGLAAGLGAVALMWGWDAAVVVVTGRV